MNLSHRSSILRGIGLSGTGLFWGLRRVWFMIGSFGQFRGLGGEVSGP